MWTREMREKRGWEREGERGREGRRERCRGRGMAVTIACSTKDSGGNRPLACNELVGGPFNSLNDEAGEKEGDEIMYGQEGEARK